MPKEPAPAAATSTMRSGMAERAARMTPPLLWHAALIVACVSCSLVLDADRLQCARDTDCARRGFGDARCDQGVCAPSAELEDVVMSPAATLEPPAAGEPKLAPGAPMAHAAPAIDEHIDTELLPAPGVRLELRFELPRRSALEPRDLAFRLCRLEDEVCNDEGLSAVPVPDATGLLRLELADTFRGYLEINAPELVPTLAALPLPYPAGAEPVSYRLLELRDLELLLRRSDLPRDADRGFAIALVHDAAGARAGGGELSLGGASAGDPNEEAIAYYFSSGIPSRAARWTDAQGAGGWSQLPAGVLVAQARDHASGAPMGVAEFRSRPGHISIVPLHPEAAP